MLLVYVAILWALPIWVANEIGKPKNRAGWAWGLIGWLGVIIVSLLPAIEPKRVAVPDLTVDEALIGHEEMLRKPGVPTARR